MTTSSLSQKLGFALARSLNLNIPRHPGEPEHHYQTRLSHAVRDWKQRKDAPSPPPPVVAAPPVPSPEPLISDEAVFQALDADPEDEVRLAIEAMLADTFKFGDEDTKDCYRLVVAATHLGTSADKLASYLGLNRDKFVRPRAKRLRDAGLWVDGKVCISTLTDTEDDRLIKALFAALVADDLIEVDSSTD